MNRILFLFAGALTAPSLLLVDSAVKGAALLILAAIATLILRRDSAATRHLVWLLAIIAMLTIPPLSAILPQWRILPEWAKLPSTDAVANLAQPSAIRPIVGPTEGIPTPMPEDIESPVTSTHQPAIRSDSQPTAVTRNAGLGSMASSWNWTNTLPFVWAVGCCTLILRLLAARWMLWKTERYGTVIGSSQPSAKELDDPIIAVVHAAVLQLGLHRRVSVLIHSDKTIPVVWGILRSRLLLPSIARDWSSEQLQSVLLHELAHIKRRDTLAQLLTQIACALHWFNPLVWFAAWRLGVERERACDDLVLASGVRPSAYAGHLLDVVTGLSSARWTQTSGLAMARKSSLEGRLVAVLSKNLNRRDVSMVLVAVALLLGMSAVIPIAMLRADDKWIPPQAAHISANNFTTFCVHHAKTPAFVVAYHGSFTSSSDLSSNAKTRTWHDDATLAMETPAGKKNIALHREHTSPNKLTLGGKDYDLANGRVFLLNADGVVRQFAIQTPIVEDKDEAARLEKQIAAIPPQVREPLAQKPTEGTKLKPGLEDRLQWGETVNGLRAALVRPAALDEPIVREIFDFKFVVQNVSDAPIRLSNAAADSKRHYLQVRKHGVIVTAFEDTKPAAVDVLLQPREVAILRMFSGSIEGEPICKDGPELTFTGELTIEKAATGAWSGKLVTADMVAAIAGYGLLPKNKEAQVLFKLWNAGVRDDGKIPGAFMGLLGENVQIFTTNNPTWQTTPQLLKMLPRFDATHDWSGHDALALLDELAVTQDTPIYMAAEKEQDRIVRTGKPLPPDLANAPWGEALPNGLRMAWLLEPRAAEHRLNAPLKSRILIHNAGKTPVVFRTRTWHQGGHKAHDAKGAEINIESVFWTTIGRLLPYRLAPGEFVEMHAAGIGVGPNKNDEDWQHTRVGSWIQARAGDEVTFTPDSVPMSDWNEELVFDGEPPWWRDFIKARLQRTLPLPADKREREVLLYRAAMDLFGTPVSAEINAAFVADREPNALDSLVERLVHRPGLQAWTGPLTSSPTKFKVLPADPDAAKKPRTANNPGRYTLADSIALVVSRRPDGERVLNEAHLALAAPAEPHPVKLPDGYDTWAAAWVRGTTVLWIAEKGLLRKIDFANSASVQEVRFEADNVANAPIPSDIRNALRAALPQPDVPKQQPKPPASK